MLQLLTDLLIKAMPTIIAGMVSFLFAAILGNRIASYWAYRQKKKEELLSTVNDFYSSYGEFYALWKIWNHYKHTNSVSFDDSRRWDILERACKGGATLESMIVRLTSERELSSEDIQLLGAWRTIYHTLRVSIEKNEPLPWYSSDDPGYFQFKSLAPKVAALVLDEKLPGALKIANLESALYEITSGAWLPPKSASVQSLSKGPDADYES